MKLKINFNQFGDTLLVKCFYFKVNEGDFFLFLSWLLLDLIDFKQLLSMFLALKLLVAI